LPDELVAEIEAEARERQVSRSNVVRGRLSAARLQNTGVSGDPISDLIGAVDGLRVDLSRRKKKYLRKTGYGQKRSR